MSRSYQPTWTRLSRASSENDAYLYVFALFDSFLETDRRYFINPFTFYVTNKLNNFSEVDSIVSSSGIGFIRNYLLSGPGIAVYSFLKWKRVLATSYCYPNYSLLFIQINKWTISFENIWFKCRKYKKSKYGIFNTIEKTIISSNLDVDHVDVFP